MLIEAPVARTHLTDRLSEALKRSAVGRATAELGSRVVPIHWSFMFAEVALYSFLIVLVTGAFLMFFYDPSSTVVAYDGSYAPLSGIDMSRALDSTLHISFDVRGGLLVRQAHHWASLLMLAALGVHLLSMFFTGAFRKPRRLSWMIVFAVFILSLVGGLTGYALPDDLLAGTGLRIVNGIILGIPVAGTWLSFLIFGGEFPGNVVATFYPVHLIVSLLIIVLIGAYVQRLIAHRPAQFAGPGRTNENVVGVPLLPKYALLTGGPLVLVFALITVIAATVTINPIWTYGPSSPSDATAGSQPDWYTGFLDGALRLVPPGWEVVLFGRTVTFAVLAPLAVVGVFMTLVAVYPLIEGWITGDKREHHILDRPRNAPTRTGVGVAGVVFYGTLWSAASADIVATQFGLSAESVIHGYQAMLVLGPAVGFVIARRVALGLQRKDRELVLHGVETGRIVRLPGGEYVEVHRPLDAYERWRLIDFEAPAPAMLRPDARGRITVREQLRVRLTRLFFANRVSPVTREVSRDERD